MTTSLRPAERDVLRAMASGWTLRDHRDVEGSKVHQLHALHGAKMPVPAAVVAALVERGLIDSNKKFPAATYWLTPHGRSALGPP